MTKTNDALQLKKQVLEITNTWPSHDGYTRCFTNRMCERCTSVCQLILSDRKRLIERLETEAVGEDVVLKQSGERNRLDAERNTHSAEIRQRFDTIKREELQGGGL